MKVQPIAPGCLKEPVLPRATANIHLALNNTGAIGPRHGSSVIGAEIIVNQHFVERNLLCRSGAQQAWEKRAGIVGWNAERKRRPIHTLLTRWNTVRAVRRATYLD